MVSPRNRLTSPPRTIGSSALDGAGVASRREVAERQARLGVVGGRLEHALDQRRVVGREVVVADDRLGDLLQPLEAALGADRLVGEVLAGADGRRVRPGPGEHEEAVGSDVDVVGEPESRDRELQRVPVDAGLGAGRGQLLRVGVAATVGEDLDLARP